MSQIAEIDVMRLPHHESKGTSWHVWVADRMIDRSEGKGRWVQLPDETGAKLDNHDALVAMVDRLANVGNCATCGLHITHRPDCVLAALLDQVGEE